MHLQGKNLVFYIYIIKNSKDSSFDIKQMNKKKQCIRPTIQQTWPQAKNGYYDNDEKKNDKKKLNLMKFVCNCCNLFFFVVV